VVLLYEGNVYTEKIINFKAEHIYISAMVKSLKSWKLTEEPNILEYEWSVALGGVNPPKRGFFRPGATGTSFFSSYSQLVDYGVFCTFFIACFIIYVLIIMVLIHMNKL
jgi:hypothetical protein